MHSTVPSLTLPSLASDERERLLADKSLCSLFAVFTTLPDPRCKQGQRYDLPYLLTCLVAALLCHCDSTLAVGQWCRDQRDLLERLFGPRRFLCPSDSLYRRLLPRLNAEQLEWAIADWVRATLQAAPDEPLALDGKTIRGAKQAGHSGPHLLSFCTHHSQEVLLQMRVGDKTNEIPVAYFLLPCLPVTGRVYTADALHTHLPLLELIWSLGGYVVLVVKDNQPTLAADLATYFADPLARYEQDSTTDFQRGRIEVRSIKMSTEMNAYLSTWPHLTHVAELQRTVTVRSTGKTTHEVVYLLAMLPSHLASPQCLLELARGHWCIENSLHYVRDVTFGEDRCRLRTGNAPQILAALRNLVITLIHRWGSSQIAASRRHFASHPQEAFALLLPAKAA